MPARGQRRPVIVGFAAETDDVLRHGREKLRRKGCDLLVVNEVGDGRGFAVDHNSAVVLSADGDEVPDRRRLEGSARPPALGPRGASVSFR